MENLIRVAGQVAVLFILIGCGVLSRRFHLISDEGSKGMTNILIKIVTPCLVIDAFQRPFNSALLHQLFFAFGVAIAIHVALIALSYLVIRRGGRLQMPVYRTAVVFSNAGFMGIPLEQAILGDEGVFFGVAYVAVFNIFMFTWGEGHMRCSACVQTNESGLGQVLRTGLNPGTIGILIGLPLFLLSYSLPPLVAEPVGMMASLNTPLAMLVIGYYLGGANLKAFLTNRGAYFASFLRLVVAPLALIGVFALMKDLIDPVMGIALVTAASAPVAAMTAMFAVRHGCDVPLAVGLVSGTILLSVITMPPIIALAMSVLQ